ncbi:hypothetical protein NQK81_13195 [Amycolatopsis roodepoortensis]|uniref:DUF6879 family protein n=1 Tax=Amycolatopsis roodepoortensis TaxID=700274 RepID=UPI00214ACCD9|nr:DUF6879 family protein [Amycolatopsis roodepoortensis]UUV34360.1 hypothetical protein NQK81_13195 [Amycolatopsis roodepoortensis]
MTWVNRGAEFADLLRTFKTSAWRWECQGTYHEPEEQGPIQAWREGRPDFAFVEPWFAQIRRQRAEGKRFERVRMLTDPLTEYLQWLAAMTHLNIAAGEDIRWIGETEARELGAPRHDFYILDDERVAIMHFDERGAAGAEVTDDPVVVDDHRRWRDTVWPVAVRHAELFEPAKRSP